MVHLFRLISAVALVSVSSAAPMVRREDSAIGAEIPVSAPNGIPMSDPPKSSATSSSANSYQTASSYGGSSGYGSGSSYGGNSYQPPSYGQNQYSSSSMSTAWSSSETMHTKTSSAAWSTATYGSGSSSYGGSSYGDGYNDCVQQCAATYSMPAATWSPPTATSSGSNSLNIGGPVGTNGVTHTIVVAPTQGVLRFVPFSTNASVGDTLEFHWGANTHTVTQSSALEVCNKSASAGAFASGSHDKGTVYTQTVNDTKPIWFYCGTPGHCEKGMFGGVNIGANSESGSGYTPLSQYVSNITSSNSDVMAAWTYAKSKTSNNAFASGWGMSTDCSQMNDEQRATTLQNVLYNQITIGMNPTSVQGNVFKANNALSFPMDLPALLANTNASSSNTSTTTGTTGTTGTASGTGTSSSASSSGTSAGATSKNGAGALASSSVVVGFAAIAATFFAL